MDFYDKLITAILCVIVTFICVFNTFCFAEETENVELITTVDGLSVESGNLVPTLNRFGAVFPVEPGSTYIVHWSYPNITESSWIDYLFTTELPSSGVSYTDYHRVNGLQSSDFSFVAPAEGYVYLYFYSYDANISRHLTVQRVLPSSGFISAVNSLVENVGISNIWETFEISLPYVVVVVLAGFGFYLIFHNIKELSKGREKMN